MLRNTTLLCVIGGMLITAAILGGVVFFSAKHQVDTSGLDPVAAGQILVERYGCISCHQDDSSFRAPILGASFGREVTLQDGSKTLADEAYIEESLSAPSAKIRQGYQNVMPSYAEALTADERAKIIAFVKSRAAGFRTP